jgi:methionine-rich copper-binding protein CopC
MQRMTVLKPLVRAALFCVIWLAVACVSNLPEALRHRGTANESDAGQPGSSEDASWRGIAETAPPIGATAVALDTNVRITFDRKITAGDGAISVHERITQAEVETVDMADERVSIKGDTLTVDWDGMLSAATGYYVLIEPGAVLDGKGKPFAGLVQPEDYPFTTRAPSALTVVSTVPGSGDSNVALDEPISFMFNQPIVPGLKGNVAIVEADTMGDFELISITDETRVAISGRELSLQHQQAFAYGTNYRVTIDAGAIQSTSGAMFGGVAGEAALSFTTLPPPQLELIDTVPTGGQTNVDTTSTLVLIFGEPIVAGEGAITVRRADDDSVVEVVTLGEPSVAVSGITLSVDLEAELATDTEYYVTVEAGAVVGETGATFAGISDATTFSFTTADSAATPLKLLSRSPASGAVDVPTNTRLQLEFSEPVVVGPGVVSLFSSEDGQLVETVDVMAASQVELANETVDVSLAAPLEGSKQYYVTVGAGSFQSLSGASFAGITDSDEWSFTTERVFGIAQVAPIDDAVAVSPTTDLSLTFTYDIMLGEGDLQVRATSDDKLVESVAMDSDQVSVAGRTLTVDLHSILGSETEYYVVVDGAAITSTDGEAWSGLVDNTRWTFTTRAVDFPAGNGNGLVLWFDAEYPDSIFEDSGVALWADRSGKYNNVIQNSRTAQPELVADAIRGKAALRFDGDDSLQAMTILEWASHDGFIVWQSDVTGDPGVKRSLFTNDRNVQVNQGHQYDSSRNAVQACFGTNCVENSGWDAAKFTPEPTAEQPSLWNFGFDAITTTLFARSNGSTPINETGPTTTPWPPESPPVVGGCAVDDCGFSGDIGELIVYSRTLTPEERAATVAYLRDKWALAAPTCASDEQLGPNGSCYFLGTAHVPWALARASCQRRGSGWDLATIRSAEEHEFVSGLLAEDTAIGASDDAVDGTWRWVTDTLQFWDGNSTGAATHSAFTAWSPLQPLGLADLDCASYWSVLPGTWQWAAYDCADALQYLCEGPAD